ncbi:MAG: Rpn family recombination-promoting nuclease/putative transposase [Treponema sp.]|nr:Rpn family recombination-promoting nuclease/putative transposase [Treponema sp.]
MNDSSITPTERLHYQIIIDDEVRQKASEAVAQKRLLNLKNDIVFKSFFSKECIESAYCRKKMLSAVIGRTVMDTTVLNPEILPTRLDGKFPRLDIHCRLDDGSEVEVEMQNSMYQEDQVKRSVYYAAALTHNSLSSGDQYDRLPAIYQIQFVDFKIVNDTRLHHTYIYREKDDGGVLSDIVQIHYIELPKIRDILKKQPKDLSEIEFWVMLIMSHEEPKVWDMLSGLTARQEEMKMAQTLLNTMSRDLQEWENQYGYERFVHDCISREKSAYSRGEEKGRQQGMQQGIQQGIQLGSSQKAIEDAENLLKMKIGTTEQIAQAIGIPLEKVQEIAENILLKTENGKLKE